MQIFSGIDSVEIDRIKKSMESETFMRRVFSEKEHELFKIRNYPPETVAANFCVKEAVANALEPLGEIISVQVSGGKQMEQLKLDL